MAPLSTEIRLTLSEPAFFFGQSWTGGGGIWGIWGIDAKHNYCDDFSDDYFEVCNISVAQNLMILETIMPFCWKIQKIRMIF